MIFGPRTKIMMEQKFQRQGGDGCTQTDSPKDFPAALLGLRQLVSHWNQLFIHRVVFFHTETGVGCIKPEFLNNNISTKCLEQTAFAAAEFIMQAELSLIR